MIPANSHYHLVAEAVAFPLWHESSLVAGTHALSRSAVGVSTDPIARPLESWLCRHALGASLPQLAHLRDLAWFPGCATTVTLAQHVARVAHEHLELRGRRVGLRLDNSVPFGELMEQWRWLSLALPSDLLVAALSAARRVDPPSEHVELVTPHLNRTLQAPCAETHLHVGAAVPFGVLWAGLMRSVAEERDHRGLLKKLREVDFRSVLPFRDADRFLQLLRSASLTRVVLAAFLRQREQGGATRYGPFVGSWMGSVAQKTAWAWGAADVRRGLRGMLDLLLTPNTEPLRLHVYARALLSAVLGPRRTDRRDPHFDAIAADPLSAWLTSIDHPALPETRLCARALVYLLGPGAADAGFAKAFWQYQRVRGATFRTLTQEAGTAGLHWFTRFYNRIGFYRKLLPKHHGQEPSWFHALRTESRDLNLGALEARTSPEDTVAGNTALIRSVARQAFAFRPEAGALRPEVGLVLHFIKEDSYTRRRDTFLHADPGNLAFGSRHALWFHAQRRRAVAVARALRDMPELLLVLRGIDVANLEQAQPAWVLRPLFDIVRDASEHASRRLSFVAPSWRVPPVRATLHAGEDYLRIVEGMRRMHEAIEFGLLRQGDRFGHGLAVGADPDVELGTTVAQPTEERLDDLLWELDRYARGCFPGSASRIERVRREARALACDLYAPGDDAADVDQLIEARRLRHDPAVLVRLRYPAVDASLVRRERTAWRLLQRHLTDHDVFVRGRVPVAVESTPEEGDMLREAQRWMQRELARREITIEANPSSNLLIGDLRRLAEHPALRLQPVDDAGRQHPVHLSLNTDNPITFGSSLGDEFAFVYAALLRMNVAARDALSWVDARREDGWRSRFTLEASAETANLAQLLPEERGRRSGSLR